jgi:hypothetical protein
LPLCDFRICIPSNKIKFKAVELFFLKESTGIMPPSSVLLPPSRIRNPATSKSAAPTPAQRTARAERNSKLQTEINKAIDEWTKSTLNTASELARRFDKKERYFLDIFFQGGAHLVHKQTKVNPFNAFKHLKAEELRDGETFLL